MKKVLFVLAIVLGGLTFSSCTDDSINEIEQIKRTESQLIDKDDIEEPNDRED
jgi:hypothetical protein